jgi:site-specific DNA recombinase
MSNGVRAAIYARYSSELQSNAYVEDQVRLCRDLIERHCLTYLKAYADYAMSGASALRPGYQSLLEDAHADRFDVVVAEALDRLTRDQADIANLYKQLTFQGIKIITLAEGEITELHVGLKGTMNALFLKDLAHKTRRGLRGRIEAGRSGGGLCYGYDVIREQVDGSKLNSGARRINEAEAEIVRQIFSAFASGRSPRRIAFELNRARIPAPGNAEWAASTINGNIIRGTGILNNELYRALGLEPAQVREAPEQRQASFPP